MRTRTTRLLTRWALITASIAALLFLSAGTTHVTSIRRYLAVSSALLLVTMLAVDPHLAQERAHPRDAGIDDELRFAAGFFYLITLTVAALSVVRVPSFFKIP